MEVLVHWFSNNLAQFISPEGAVFIISMIPILELRGGLLAASLLKISAVKAIPLCVIGNIIPIPFILHDRYHRRNFLCYLHLSAGSPAERTFYCKRQRPFSRNGNIHRQSGNLSGRGNIRGFLPDLHGRPAGTYHKPAASSRPACNFRMT